MNRDPTEPRSFSASIQTLWVKLVTFWEHKVLPWARAKPAQAAVVGGAVVVGALLYVGSATIVNGVIAGALVAAAVGILLWKLGHSEQPQLKQVYSFLVDHPLGTDVGVSVLAFLVSPAGITGWVAAAVAALLASIWLLGAQKAVNESAKEADLENTVIIQLGD